MMSSIPLEAAYHELRFRFQRGDLMPHERILDLIKRRIEMTA